MIIKYVKERVHYYSLPFKNWLINNLKLSASRFFKHLTKN